LLQFHLLFRFYRLSVPSSLSVPFSLSDFRHKNPALSPSLTTATKLSRATLSTLALQQKYTVYYLVVNELSVVHKERGMKMASEHESIIWKRN
jgi:hypothetical protein